ncbi:hypothetical protein IMZ11_13275 [Microtetraspora sp. AC03309]|uniref:hypothetical protein n=1 Tax=Microtetraspora sp. AC03309 TaxID=2779376 RepID=UPI001E478DDC|nr:hypothetical protein [Microtetraspora sp. AC03309]MCC5576601.1 hypothetical protein [Microtetraspora sp. AC03309]
MDSPISAVLVSWGNAWLGGHVGLDEAVDRVERAGGPQVVADGPMESTLRAFLAGLRSEGLDSFRLALPVPGDPLGLAGPPAFNISAIDAGQAVIAVLRGRRLGLVPESDRRGSSYSGVRWTVVESADSEPYVPSLAEAEHALTSAMRTATDVLHGVAGPGAGTPTLEDVGEDLAPGYPGRAHRVGALAARLAMALRLAGERGLTSGQLAVRSEALRELDRAVRRARVAAHHAIVEGQRQG